MALRIMFTQIEQEIEGPFFDGDAFHLVDGVWGTIFRYFGVFNQFGDFRVMTNLDHVLAWREALAQRKTIRDAVPVGYNERLVQFLKYRNSYLSTLMGVTHSNRVGSANLSMA